MIKKSGKPSFSDGEDADPMTSIVNMVDIMLVLAVGFLILAITSVGIDQISYNPDSQNSSMPLQDAINVSQGKEVPNTIQQAEQTGSGYNKVGSVYRDPDSGKLIMVEG